MFYKINFIPPWKFPIITDLTTECQLFVSSFNVIVITDYKEKKSLAQELRQKSDFSERRSKG